jgi:TPR repeat protein
MTKIMAAFFWLILPAAAQAQTVSELERLGVQAAAKQDWVSAQKYLKAAAESGDPTSEFEYAFLLETSAPPVQDQVQAYAWYTVVMLGGGDNATTAATCRNRVAKKLTGEEVGQARSEAQKLIAKFRMSLPD